MLDKPLWENIGQVRAIAQGGEARIIRGRDLRARAREHVERLQVRANSVDDHAGQLSGGNQQKVVFAKWLDAQPSVLLLDDPTRGVDVGAKAEMHVLDPRRRGGRGDRAADLDRHRRARRGVRPRARLLPTAASRPSSPATRLSEHAVLEAMNTGEVAAAA